MTYHEQAQTKVALEIRKLEAEIELLQWNKKLEVIRITLYGVATGAGIVAATAAVLKLSA